MHTISRAAQTATRAYWTPARMAGTASAPAPVPQAAAMGPQSSRQRKAKAPYGTPGSWAFSGVPTVGALFYTTGTGKHFCTGSVIHTQAGSIVLTAAHCVFAGSFAHNVEFVPGYANGAQPYGVWAVTQISVAWGWKRHQDPNLDVAFLNVVPPPDSAGPIEQVTGALTMAFALPDAQKNVNVIGYNDSDKQPIRCVTSTFRFRHLQMEFYCKGFSFGTSGGPWIIGYNRGPGTGTVFGVIGGYEWGGYKSWASYSAAFEKPAKALLQQAVSAAIASGQGS
jgi:V8-like Glu-specific endopeptidase